MNVNKAGEAKYPGLTNSLLTVGRYPVLSCQSPITAKPTERQKRLTILGDSLAKQSESRQCEFLWKSVLGMSS